jgi:hypothetical protein
MFADIPMHPFPRVRAVRDDEFNDLIRMAGAIHAEYGLGPTWVESDVRDLLEKQSKDHCVVSVGTTGRMEGTMVLSLNNLWFNRGYWTVQDRWVYVSPEYRADANNISDLLGFATWYAHDFLNIPLVISIMSTDRGEAKTRLFKKHLKTEPIGGMFLVEPAAQRID